MPLELSAADARRLAIVAQGLSGRRHRDPLRLLDRLSAIQIDTISVIARSHELVAFSRLGPVSRTELARAWWGRGRTFEYWAHAACVVPLSLWPLFAWRRRRYARRHGDRTSEQERILARLGDLGPLTVAELGGMRIAPGWWEWSPIKSAVEHLLARGDVVCTERRGFRRVYRLTEQAIPQSLLATDLDDAACHTALVALGASHMGVATEDDLADYFRLPIAAIAPAAAAAALIPVTVRGWRRPAWADPRALQWASRQVQHRPVLLSPFDSLIWHRPRTERLFGFRHRLEAYTPAAQRQHGYFVMPLLAGARLVGRVDPKRDGTVLRARRVSLEPTALTAMAQALSTAAVWVGCDEVDVEDVSPAGLGDPLRAALRSPRSGGGDHLEATGPLLPFELGHPGTALRRRLVEAVLGGTKTATSSLREDYHPHAGERLPRVGDRCALLDIADRQVGIVEVTSVSTRPLAAVSLQFAIDEGEGCTSVAEWREQHARFWAPRQVDDDTLVVCERFRLL
ncbi:MAG: DNA glycosylase AlkZ-like family protein [Candidatus Dormibacteria bacterium]